MVCRASQRPTKQTLSVASSWFPISKITQQSRLMSNYVQNAAESLACQSTSLWSFLARSKKPPQIFNLALVMSQKVLMHQGRFKVECLFLHRAPPSTHVEGASEEWRLLSVRIQTAG